MNALQRLLIPLALLLHLMAGQLDRAVDEGILGAGCCCAPSVEEPEAAEVSGCCCCDGEEVPGREPAPSPRKGCGCGAPVDLPASLPSLGLEPIPTTAFTPARRAWGIAPPRPAWTPRPHARACPEPRARGGPAGLALTGAYRI